MLPSILLTLAIQLLFAAIAASFDSHHRGFDIWLYHSIVTATTVGYGTCSYAYPPDLPSVVVMSNVVVLSSRACATTPPTHPSTHPPTHGPTLRLTTYVRITNV